RPPCSTLCPYTPLFRSRGKVRLDDAQLVAWLAREQVHHLDGRRLSQVVDVGLVGEPEAGDARRLQALGAALDALGDPARLVVVGDRKSTRLNSSHVKIS